MLTQLKPIVLSSRGTIKLNFSIANQKDWLVEQRCAPIFSSSSGRTKQEAKLKFTLIGAAVLFGAASATPALAQAVISDPGYCAQFYPNANCQNLGPGNPYTDGGYHQYNWQNSNASIEHHRKRHHEAHRR